VVTLEERYEANYRGRLRGASSRHQSWPSSAIWLKSYLTLASTDLRRRLSSVVSRNLSLDFMLSPTGNTVTWHSIRREPLFSSIFPPCKSLHVNPLCLPSDVLHGSEPGVLPGRPLGAMAFAPPIQLSIG